MHVPRASLTWLALAALAGACRHEQASAGGQGLVILPDDGPLGSGVAARDPRLNYWDFGTVQDGDVVTHVFRMQNSDSRPVAITRVDPGCGCTVAALRVVHADGSVAEGEPIRSKAPKLLTILPGEVGQLEVRMDTRDLSTKNSHKLTTLRVATDSPNGYFMSFEVHIYVTQPFALVPGTLAFGEIPESGGGTTKVEIVQALRGPQELKELGPLPEGMSAELVKEIRNVSPVWVLTLHVEPPLARGPLRATLHVTTETAPGVAGRDLEVPVTGTVVGDLVVDPARLVFRASRSEASQASCELFSLLSGQRLRVTGIDVPAEQRGFVVAQSEPVEADDAGQSKRWRITLTTQPPLPDQELLTGKLLVHLDDPQHPELELEYVLHLR
jgi:hypothetical protein